MAHALFIEIFDESRQDSLDDFAVDRVTVDERNKLIDNSSHLLRIDLNGEEELND